jgi:hypothetical protein
VPYPRLRADAVDRIAEAAGFAPACAYETSDEWHNALVVQWRRRTRRARLSNVSPSVTSLCLALVLVVM